MYYLIRINEYSLCSNFITCVFQAGILCSASDSGLETHSYGNTHHSRSTQSSSINSPLHHRLVVSPSSTTSSHFCSVEMREDCTEGESSHSPDQLMDKVMKGYSHISFNEVIPEDVISVNTMTTSHEEHLFQLSDSFPEKLMILASPVEEYLTFSDESDDDSLGLPGIKSTLSLNEVLEEPSGLSVTTNPRDESFDSMPAFHPRLSQNTSVNNTSPRHHQPTGNAVRTSPLRAHEHWKPSSPLPSPINNQHPTSIKTRCCLIQRPTSLELLSNTNKLIHMFDNYLNDSSSSNSDMTSSRTGQLHHNVVYQRTGPQASPTVYHVTGQRLSIADSSHLIDVCQMPNKACNQSYDGSSTSHSPQSISTINNSSSQTPLSYGSPPVNYSEATASTINNGVPTNGAEDVVSNNPDSTISTPVLHTSSSPDSAMQHSFSSSSCPSDNGETLIVDHAGHTIDKLCYNRDDGYASNSTTSVSLSDIQKINMSKLNTDLGLLVENGEKEDISSGSGGTGSLTLQCSDMADWSASIESNKIGSVRDITACFEVKFETQQIRVEPSPQIKMPPRLKYKPVSMPCDPYQPIRTCCVRRTMSDSSLCVKRRSSPVAFQYTRCFSYGNISSLTYRQTGDSMTCLMDLLKRDRNNLQCLFAHRPSLLMDRSCSRSKRKQLLKKIAPDTVSMVM